MRLCVLRACCAVWVLMKSFVDVEQEMAIRCGLVILHLSFLKALITIHTINDILTKDDRGHIRYRLFLLIPIEIEHGIVYNVHYKRTYVFARRTDDDGSILCRSRGYFT